MSESEEKIILLQWHNNNCFAIAVVQCMLNIPPVVDILIQFLKNLNIAGRYIKGIDDEFKDTILMNFAVVAKFIKNNPQGIGNHSLKIQRLLLSVYKLCGLKMRNFGDSYQFLCALYHNSNMSIKAFNSRCEQLKKDHGLDLTISTLESVFELTWTNKYEVCNHCGAPHDDSPGGEIMNLFRKCDFIKSDGEIITTSFKTAFQNYLNYEDDIACAKCLIEKEDGKSVIQGCIPRKRYVEKLPQYLILVLATRYHDFVQFDCNVETEFEVELSNGKKGHLELSCSTIGRGGHEISIIKKDDKWFHCDDYSHKHKPRLINNVSDYFTIKRGDTYDRFILFYKCMS